MRPKKPSLAPKVRLLLGEVRQLTQERDDLILLLLATQLDCVCEVDLAGRPIVLTTYRGTAASRVRLVWRGDIPRLSVKTRASLKRMLRRDGRLG